jgi:putative ubiquitin-RnfH superfamily antitoxin RatB of RatAB toxin-antitoxin module
MTIGTSVFNLLRVIRGIARQLEDGSRVVVIRALRIDPMEAVRES